ncbi:helix-turn-helix transcriptional regulator [Leuconostocaceae bacterium ESL0958]|nr:helix-turn-helix transcriptional regulator [Leuconostocaceae bacterium ESL0958]
MSSLGNKEILSNNIKHLLNKNAMTPAELADKLDIKRTTVYDWVNGVTYPRIDKLEMIADFFKVKKSALVEKQSVDESEQKITDILDNETILAFDGKPIDDEDKQKLLEYARFILHEREQEGR